MLEIGADDLRFTWEDAASLFKELKTPGLSAKDVVTLNERTEGWVVGLKMAAFSLRNQKDVPGFLASFTGSHRYVMDYLMEEVLRQQTKEVKEFLLQTSVLNRLTAPLCNAVTGRKDGNEMLLLLERAHLFIVLLDESRQWHRYEHLFTDLLRHQLDVAFGVEKVAELHRRASQWYEEHDFPDDAINHAVEAKDWERTIKIIKEQYTKKLHNGEFITLFNWLQKIPEDVIHHDLDLCKTYGMVLLMVGQFDKAISVANYLEQTVERDNITMQGEIDFLRSHIAFY
jgi:LuxR family maltose regulon positive regulatory protein